eukprot:gnl/MRDRNA2_/MRDRNA2_65412_c0_seq1.p1 gnl/MRDRNA2_/MRDRNA2_65412_c0~~gnl/MRDRNA2_/MRDRNA2_65412_c0_seq1.p1  ORF type:complete len:263 (+),score=60.01 gnl/MRDRNA2_/MRDRNA2_65412_c0_seq1:98-886(+)
MALDSPREEGDFLQHQDHEKSREEIIVALRNGSFHDLEGRLLRGLKLLRHQGHGSATAVFHAQYVSGGQEVGVKFLLPNANALERLQYLREYATAKFVASEEDKMLYHLCEDLDGVVFYVMPIRDGCSLKQLQEEGAKALGIPERALLWTLGLLRHLDAAHSRGVLHLCVCPASIMVGSDHITVHLIDWGGAAYLLDLAQQHFAGLPASELSLLESAARGIDESSKLGIQDKKSSMYASPERLWRALDGRDVDGRLISSAWR